MRPFVIVCCSERCRLVAETMLQSMVSSMLWFMLSGESCFVDVILLTFSSWRVGCSS